MKNKEEISRGMGGEINRQGNTMNTEAGTAKQLDIIVGRSSKVFIILFNEGMMSV